MSKNKIIVILLIMLSIGIISLYTTYAYEGDNTIKEPSDSNYNLIYSLKDNTNKEITINPREDKFIDINLLNTYDYTVKYGMYYYLLNPTKLPDNVTITLANSSKDLLVNTIKPNQERVVSIRIMNNSDYTIQMIIGALIGFENGNIEDLVSDGEVLIK